MSAARANASLIECERRLVVKEMRVRDLEALIKFINEEHFLLTNQFRALQKKYKEATGKEWP
jgi:hypothetical protein